MSWDISALERKDRHLDSLTNAFVDTISMPQYQTLEIGLDEIP